MTSKRRDTFKKPTMETQRKHNSPRPPASSLLPRSILDILPVKPKACGTSSTPDVESRCNSTARPCHRLWINHGRSRRLVGTSPRTLQACNSRRENLNGTLRECERWTLDVHVAVAIVVPRLLLQHRSAIRLPMTKGAPTNLHCPTAAVAACEPAHFVKLNFGFFSSSDLELGLVGRDRL